MGGRIPEPFSSPRVFHMYSHPGGCEADEAGSSLVSAGRRMPGCGPGGSCGAGGLAERRRRCQAGGVEMYCRAQFRHPAFFLRRDRFASRFFGGTGFTDMVGRVGGEIPGGSLMKVTGFNHVTIRVSDLETSLDFYRDVLGMELVHRGRIDAYLEWGHAWVCLVEREGEDGEATLGVDHVAFSIEEED